MTIRRPHLTRRSFALRCGAALTMVALPRRAESQTALPFRILRAKPGHAELTGPGRSTSIWGYDGSVPGPTLRIKRGEELRVRLVNELVEPTTIHWRGLRLPNAMDGVPHLTQAPVPPGGSFDYRFTPPDAGTFWYHPHINASEQLGRGLHGLLIVDESEPPEVDQDIALVFSDWRLGSDGAAAHEGIGNVLTVNGKPALEVPVRTNERLRLRLVNVSSARLMRIRFDRHRAVIVAVDGQPAEPFVARDAAVVLSPGTRIDAFVDATLGAGASAPIVVSGYGHESAMAHLVYQDGAPARPEPLRELKPLPANPLPERMNFSGSLKLDIPIGGRASSGREEPPLFTIKRGRTAMLAFNNRTAHPYAMHVHGHHFRLLDRLDDGWKPFWLDTVLVMPSEIARIAFVADNPGKWAICRHMLDRQETGMRAWFEVS